MTWKDRLTDIPFTITCGDGVSYTPQMTKSVVEITFNTRDFLYLNEQGTYVSRKEAQGEVYPLEFWFVGDNHVTLFQAFKTSSKNKNPWTISHPFYDEIIVQPESLRFESQFGQTVVSGLVKHTLPNQLPDQQQDLTKDIKNATIEIDQEVVSNVEAINVTTSTLSINVIATNYDNLPNTQEGVVFLKDKVRDATNLATQILSKPVEFNESLKALIKFPYEIAGEVKSSILSCKNALIELVSLAESDIGLFDLNSTILLTSSMEIAIDANYKYRGEVSEVQSLIVEMYELQRTTFEDNKYEAESNNVLSLSIILSKTLGRLNEIAFNSKQEIIVKNNYSASPIIFCHEYYGTSDDAFDRFCDENKLTVDERILISSGKELVYYV